MTDHDPIEIKVNIGGDVDRALTVLDLGEGKARKVWFLDDVTEGLKEPLPLLKENIILRLRRRDNGKEDSTVKLRPCRRSQLAGKWAVAPTDDDEYRIEGDWSRDRHVLAASCVAELERGTIENALDGSGRIADVFSDRQREFLADCGHIPVELGAVTVLGARAIAAIQWKDDVSVGSVPDVVAERWTLDELDFLELSIRVDSGPDDAAAAQRKLHDEVASQGLEFADTDLPKTLLVMKRLAGLD